MSDCCCHAKPAPAKAELPSCCGESEDETRDLLFRFWVGLALAWPLLLFTMAEHLPALHALTHGNVLPAWVQWLLATPVVFWCGAPLLLRAVESFRTLRLNMFSLIGLGVMAAWGFSTAVMLVGDRMPHLLHHGGAPLVYFESAAVITVLVLLGQVLETKARKATGNALESLMHLAPDTVCRVRNGVDEEVPVGKVLPGDLLRVKPASRVPVDGAVVEGTSFVDESMLTGEAMPVAKSAGAKVTGGTLNGEGSFVMRAEHVGKETVLSRIVAMVEHAQASRAPVQRLADRVARWFVPVVIAIAVITFVLWWKLGPQPSLAFGIINSVAVLIIACPCALGLATPMAVTMGVGRAAQLGVLVKNAEALEKLETVTTVMLDKTGTLTEGRPVMTLLHPLPGHNGRDVLEFAAALEQQSEHPLARAILEAAKERQIKIPKTDQFVAVPGAGVAGAVNGKEVAVGQMALMKIAEVKVPDSLQAQVARLQEKGNTIIYVAVDGAVAGIIAIADKLKVTSAEAVQRLKGLGLQLSMLTGDHISTASQIASQLGIDTVVAGLKPDEKLREVRRARDAGAHVAVAGDGINDAPALAAASVGIAMGTGTDVAMQSADVTLIRGDLLGLMHAITIGRETMKVIRQNLWFAFLYNGLGIPIAAGILYPLGGWLLNPMIASIAMSLSSISVIINSLRLRWIK